jgi:hypothetical protein
MTFFSPLEQFDTVNLFPITLACLDVSFNSVLLPLLLADVFLVLIIVFYKTSFKLVPDF